MKLCKFKIKDVHEEMGSDSFENLFICREDLIALTKSVPLDTSQLLKSDWKSGKLENIKPCKLKMKDIHEEMSSDSF